jgi:diguanylate cyclase (GGDEF)-like protein
MRRSRPRPHHPPAPAPGGDLAADDELAALRARFDLEDRLLRALEGIDTEGEVLALVGQALVERFGATTRVLVPDPAQLRLGPAKVIDPDTALVDAGGCVAFRRGEPVVTPSSRRFDACSHLRRSEPACSAVCVPVSAAGSVVGVVIWRGVEGAPLATSEVATIEAISHLAACHVLLHRATAVEPQRTDPLTGLLNPHSIDQAILRLVTELVPFSVGICSLDDLEDYNERHGHGLGDQALRVFTGCLKAAVRPDDIVGRSDLDQFTVVFPSTSALDAAHALERVRETLVLALSEGEVPTFTASFGVADSNQGESIEAIVETAGLAALLARSAGSNRVVVAGEETAGGLDPDA